MRVSYRVGVFAVSAIFLLLFVTSLSAAVTFTFSAVASSSICPGTNGAAMPSMQLSTTAGGSVGVNSVVQIIIAPGTIASVPSLAGNPSGVTLFSVQGGGFITINFAAGATFAPGSALTISGWTANVPASANGSTIVALVSFSGDTSVSAPLTAGLALVTSAACTSSIATSVSSLAFAVVPGVFPPLQSFTIRNGAQPGTNLSPSVSAISTPVGWLGVVVGTETAGVTTVTVQVSASGMAEGSYTGTITISATQASNSVNIAVTLRLARFSIISPLPSALSFVAEPSKSPPSQALVVSNEGVGVLDPDASAQTDSGGPWLFVVSPPTTGEPTTFQVSVDSATLSAGTYTGTILIFSATASNSPLRVPVTLAIRAPTPSIALSPTSLRFSSDFGTNPAPQTFTVSNSDIGTLAWGASSSVDWLRLSPATGTAPTTVTVNVNTSGLQPGTYAVAVTISSFSDNTTNSPQTVTVVVTVQAPIISVTPVITLGTTSLSFSGLPNTNPPAAQTVSITNTSTGTLNWSAAANTTTGGAWLSVSPASGTAPSTLSVSVDISRLAAGLYSGTITISSTGATATPATITVTLTLGVPKINANGVVNAAHLQAAGLAPGGLITIFGTNLAASTRTAPPLPYLPDELGGTVVKIGTFKARLSFVSPSQINAQVPTELSDTNAAVKVSVAGADSDALTLPVLPFDPGLFTFLGEPGGPAAALHSSDYSAVNASSPALRGSVILLFGTGFGPVTPSVSSGQPGSSKNPLNQTVGTVIVLIGGKPARVFFDGEVKDRALLAPGLVGVYQVNVEVPADAATGDSVSVVVGIGGRGTNMATLPVR